MPLAIKGLSSRTDLKWVTRFKMIEITHMIAIADWEISEQFYRASGPGGQNVNKVSTAVELRFAAAASPNLSGPVKTRLRRLAGRKWTQDGVVVIKAQKHRSQAMNRELALEKLSALIQKAALPPKPRIKTRPSLAAQRRRLDAKKQRSQIKTLRSKAIDD